tara:strand:- start:15390 stop:16028 length:639 start_codon:yes stop_codon:yes gene_type:complete
MIEKVEHAVDLNTSIGPKEQADDEVISESSTPTEPVSLSEEQKSLSHEGHVVRPATRLSPDRFYDDDYLFIIRRLSIEIIDQFGPITFRHLSEKLARLHDFHRTGSQIRKRVWAAVHSERKYTKGPTGENIFWPNNEEPKSNMSFRGLVIGNEERTWQQVPYPEKIGLALEVVNQQAGSDNVATMARRIGLARLAQRTREELEQLLADASRL